MGELSCRILSGSTTSATIIAIKERRAKLILQNPLRIDDLCYPRVDQWRGIPYTTCRILSGSTTSATDHIRLPKKVF